VLHKGDEKYLVQCKQWRAFKVGVLWELYGLMAAGGFVVTSGRFRKESSEFAQGRNVELIDGVKLQRWIGATRFPGWVGSTSVSRGLKFATSERSLLPKVPVDDGSPNSKARRECSEFFLGVLTISGLSRRPATGLLENASTLVRAGKPGARD
jgi:restriction system protein